MQYVVFGCRVVLAVVFAASALAKVRSDTFTRLLEMLEQMRLVPRMLARPAAAALTAAEFSAAVLLCVPAVYRWGLAAASVLMAALTVGVGRLLSQGAVVSCPCFGGTGRLTRVHLIRNGLLLMVCLAALALAWGGSGRATAAGLTVAGSAGLVLGLITTRVDMLAELVTGTST